MNTENKLSYDYEKTQEHLKRLSVFFLSTIVAILTISLSLFFYVYSSQKFEEENKKMREDYISLQKDMIKNRVDQACAFIESSRQIARSNLEDTIKQRVYKAYDTANFIYEKYKDKESEERIKERIKDSLEKMQFENDKSYIWIMDYRDICVLSPTNKSDVGKYLGDMKDPQGNLIIKTQAKTAKEKKEGYNLDFYYKTKQPKEKLFPQASFVKDFGRYGWYFGTAEFLDDFEQKTKDETLTAISKLKFGNNYIFVDTYDGYALIMNGEKLKEPKYSWELEDKNGIKILQEQLKTAKSSPGGGYVQYVWHEKELNKDMAHLSFVRTVDDWQWKIGTGVYIGKIQEDIENRKKEFHSQMNSIFLVVLFIFLGAVALSGIVAVTINQKTKKLFDSMNKTINKYYNELLELNKNLENRVEEEIQKRVKQENFLIQQSKMAMMGEMIDSVAHQWKQPLNHLALIVQEFCMTYEDGDVNEQCVNDFKKDSLNSILFMSSTIDDFRSFFRPAENEAEFCINEAVNSVIGILSAQLKMAGIHTNFQICQNIHLVGIENEIKQVVLNILNNAKDVLIEEKIKEPKIDIDIYEADSVLKIVIKDNGHGIPSELLPDKLFDHRISTKGGEGSGLGLWMSKMIVEKHHGTIEAKNDEFGAVFEITLPIRLF